MPNELSAEERNKILAEKLRPFYERADIPLPEQAATLASVVYTRLPPDDMAGLVAAWLAPRNLLFRRGEAIGTVDPETGEWHKMTANRFRSWLPSQGLLPWTGKFTGDDPDSEFRKPKKGYLRREDCEMMLASDALRNQLPTIERVNQVRLPVFRKGGNVELLSYGYDAETKSFTLRGLDYDAEWTLEDSQNYLDSLLQYFDMDSRSRAVQVAAMLTAYCKLMYSVAPMILWTANLGCSSFSSFAQVFAWPRTDGHCARIART